MRDTIESLSALRWKVALVLTAFMVLAYFGFILLVAFDKPLLGRLLTPGLSLGIALGAGVIFVAWILTGIYVWWANKKYDPRVNEVEASR